MIWIGVILLLLQALNIYIFFVRNNMVYRFRREILSRIDKRNREVIHKAVLNMKEFDDSVWRWRYDALESVPYWKMQLTVWKPLVETLPKRLREDLCL